jgi:uncharacterized membrane protein (UPF0127 family)
MTGRICAIENASRIRHIAAVKSIIRDLCKTVLARAVASGLWPETQGFVATRSRHSLDATHFAKVSIHLALLTTVLIIAGCDNAGPTTSAPATNPFENLPTEAQPKLQTMKIYLGAETFDAELALTPRQIQTGMMFRTNIQETDAMLFNLRYPQQASFWMKNCPESISVAYITADGVIQEIHHLEKNDTNSVVAARNDIVFALETKEGWFARHNIGVGTAIRTERGTLAETFLQQR